MDPNRQSLAVLKQELISSSKRGYPFLLAGSVVMITLGLAEQWLDRSSVHLLWMVGLGFIFPLAILFSLLLGVQLFTRNPLNTLGGIVGGIQAFYLPVWIWAYQSQPEYLPFVVGCLAGSHFLPYTWIYDSRAYLVATIGSVSVSVLFGLAFREQAYTLVPFSIAAVYLLGVWLVARENRKDEERNAPGRPLQS